MKEAFVSYGGLWGFRAAVVEADTSKEINKGGKSPGISMSSGSPDTESRSSNYITRGRWFENNPAFRTIYQGTWHIGRKRKKSGWYFSCRETGCILTYRSQSEIDSKHMDTGKHRECKVLMSQISHELMSQIWKNKSFGRNNKIKHYFYLFCRLPSLLPVEGVFLTWNLDLDLWIAVDHQEHNEDDPGH